MLLTENQSTKTSPRSGHPIITKETTSITKMVSPAWHQFPGISRIITLPKNTHSCNVFSIVVIVFLVIHRDTDMSLSRSPTTFCRGVSFSLRLVVLFVGNIVNSVGYQDNDQWPVHLLKQLLVVGCSMVYSYNRHLMIIISVDYRDDDILQTLRDCP